MNAPLAITRNGTQQYERLAAELSAEYVSIEERSVEQQLHFMQKLAGHIHFFNLDNAPDGDWSGMFENDLGDMLAYMDKPEDFAPEPDSSAAEKRNRLSRIGQLSEPQRVLVYIFARMTQAIRSRFNQLTQAHLDFYYREVLQVAANSGKPDNVHVTCTVAGGTQSTVVEKGALLEAGTDSNGDPIRYAVDETFQINRAEISDVKTLRVSRDYVSLNKMRKQSRNGFELILRWALGQYFQGDLLPSYPLGRYFDSAVDVTFLLDLHNLYSGSNPPAHGSEEQLAFENYIEVVLGFASVADFHTAMAVYAQSIDETQPFPDEDEWVLAADKIELAFGVRWQQKQMQQLVQIYKPSAFGELGRLLALFEYAFGLPIPGDRLPAMPLTSDTLESLYQQLVDPALKGTDNYKLVARYIASLGLTVNDYLFIYGMHLNSAVLYTMPVKDVLDPNQPPATSWYRLFLKIQRLEAELRGKQPPQVGRFDVRSMLPNDDVTLAGGSPAFGVADNKLPVDSYYGPGLAVVSPLLHLSEGDRHIHVEIACEQQNFPLEDLQLAKEQGRLHFNVDLSNDSGGQVFNTRSHAEVVTFSIENIGNEIIAAYDAEQVDLLASLDAGSVAVNFDDYVIFTDGSIWQVVGFGANSQQLRLRYLSLVKGLSDNRTLTTGQLDFVQEPTPLNTIQYSPTKLEVSLVSDDQGFGSVPEEIDQGDFVILNSGLVLVLTQLIEAGQKARVEELGYLPATLMNSLNAGASGERHYRLTTLAFSDVDILPDLELQSVRPNSANGDGIVFTQADLSRLIRYPNGLSLKVRHLVQAVDDTPDDDPTKGFSEALIELQPNAEISHSDLRVKKFSTYPGFVFDIFLESTLPAVAPAPAGDAVPGFSPIEPVLTVQLATLVDPDRSDSSVDMAYEFFKEVRLYSVRLAVEVKGLTELQLANDDGTLAPGQPFEPFGSEPFGGSAMYFSHFELSRKKLNKMQLNLQWVDLPENFSAYYQAYRNAYPNQVPNLSSGSFQADMSMFNIRSWIGQDQDKLLFNTDAEDISSIVIREGFTHSAYDFLPDYPVAPPGSPVDSERYFKLALQEPDFQHKIYPHVLRKTSLAASQAEGADLELINEPYTPKVKSFSVDYSAEELLEPDINEQNIYSLMAHMHPFGGIDVNKTINPARPERGPLLFPKFDDEGYLYLGLNNANPLDEVSILVQVLTGTGSANLATPRMHWYYRTLDGLIPLPPENLLHDTTQSMSFSGLIRLRLPQDATTEGPLLPADRHWLAVQVVNNADAAAKVLAFVPQSISATRTGVIASGDAAILPSGSISGFAAESGVSGISRVNQRYDSYNGLAQADNAQYYRDTAERIRHRNRAVDIWDYERLALSRFPQLRHVKCLNNAELPEGEPGGVTMMVIPELGTQPLDEVLKPAASSDLLEQVRESLQKLAPPQVVLTVKNPQHETIKFRVAIRFNPGFGPGIYSPEVNREIRKLLTPWADGQAKPQILGNRLFFSEVINYLERLPYVDYVAVLKGFKQVTLFAGSENERTQYREIEEKSFQVTRADALLVSDNDHKIDIIASEHFNPEDYMGVGYMVIELDNIVK